jgi:hypothetical protein
MLYLIYLIEVDSIIVGQTAMDLAYCFTSISLSSIKESIRLLKRTFDSKIGLFLTIFTIMYLILGTRSLLSAIITGRYELLSSYDDTCFTVRSMICNINCRCR